MTPEELAQRLDVSVDTLQQHLQRMVATGLLIREGNTYRRTERGIELGQMLWGKV